MAKTATTTRKNTDVIRFNSGAGVFFRASGTAWEDLGECESAKIVRKTDQNQAKFMKGTSVKKNGTTEANLTVVFSQNDKTVQDRLDELFGMSGLECYIDNGLEGGKYQEYYFKKVIPALNQDMELGNNKQQSITVEFSIAPQTSNVSVTPDTDLPVECHATGASPVVGKNVFWVVLDTAAA